tara:strand:+ start:190 stop:558 length:369 start_codon:yes stop_codon:yes gene_type:complete
MSAAKIRLYESEFSPEYWPPADVVKKLESKGFSDVSWHNDVAPSFEIDLSSRKIGRKYHQAVRIRVWVHPELPEEDVDIRYRFGVSALNEMAEGLWDVTFDTLEEVSAFLDTYHVDRLDVIP